MFYIYSQKIGKTFHLSSMNTLVNNHKCPLFGPKQKGQNDNQRSRIHYTENQNNEQHELNRKHGDNGMLIFKINNIKRGRNINDI
jgi:hypothetical protein